MEKPEPYPAAEPARPVYVSGGNVGAIGDNATVVMPRRSLNWPVVAGSPPAVASAFQPRTAIIEQISLTEGAVVLQHPSGKVLSGTGGVGKTQIAAGMFVSSDAHLRVWVNGESRESVVVGFSEAAVLLDLADSVVDPERLARLFLGYLSATDRPWLVVLDNVIAVSDLSGLWPPAGGRLIVTTRRRDAAFSGAGRTVIDVGVFAEAEAVNYLHERISPLLHSLPEGALTEGPELAADLGRLPLALAQAAAVIIDQGITCAEYRAWFADRANALEELFPADADADGYARTVATTWELSAAAADRIDPVGLARPMATLVSMLDPAGAPETVLTGQAACARLSEITQTQVTTAMARKALRALHRLSLIDHDTNPGNPRAIRMHNLTGRAILQTLTPEMIEAYGRSVAGGLLETWPKIEKDSLLAESLRSNTAALIGAAPAGLWHSAGDGGHGVLFRSGSSLSDAGLVGPAIQYYQQLQRETGHRLGPDHPHTLASRNHLAGAYQSAGKLDQAIPLYEQNLTDSERVLGSDHPTTLASRSNLAGAYESAGKLDQAIPLCEQTLTDSERVLGSDHPTTLTLRNNLAGAYRLAEKLDQAIPLFEQNLTDSERILGPDHPDTLTSRINLGSAYRLAGKLDQAIPLFEQTLTDSERILGPDHPTTLASRNNLALAYQSAGKLDQAIPLFEQNLTDRQRILGSDHPHTLTARNHLALAYQSAGELDRAIPLYERTLTDSERFHGPAHPHTLAFRNNLAGAYRSAGKLDQAIPLYQQTLTDSERVLGPNHPDTLAFRNNLAGAYLSAGELDQAIPLFKQ